MLKELYIYSGKTLLPTISEMLLNQTAVLVDHGKHGFVGAGVIYASALIVAAD